MKLIMVFYPGSLCWEEHEFVRNVLESGITDASYDVVSPQSVLMRFDKNLIKRISCRNYSLFSFLCTEEECEGFLNSFIAKVIEDEDFEFIACALNSSHAAQKSSFPGIKRNRFRNVS